MEHAQTRVETHLLAHQPSQKKVSKHFASLLEVSHHYAGGRGKCHKGKGGCP